ncbi:MAG: hypothetical protein JRJ87_22665 [Deltaproteobacteria bacterium]|nr:hypothetical protein [Deltaproteobacteria bacterium]
MSKSRMFGDDEPDNPNPSPRTTIVGGRPPEDIGSSHPVPVGIQRLLRLAAEDPSFKLELAERRAEVAEAAGVELTESEKMILKVITTDQLTAMVETIPPAPAPRRDFLRKTAATAVLLLGGAALEGCDSCSGVVKGARPDIPPERPEERPSPPGGARPDVPEPKPKPPVENPDDTFAKPPKGWDGGTPKPPPEPKPERPERPPITKGIRPDRPKPTRGIRPDVPPKKKEKK